MPGNIKYGEAEFGSDQAAGSTGNSTVSHPLPGIIGHFIFGQPLWKMTYAPNPGNHSISVIGRALIADVNILPNHRIFLVKGNAMIDRKNFI